MPVELLFDPVWDFLEEPKSPRVIGPQIYTIFEIS